MKVERTTETIPATLCKEVDRIYDDLHDISLKIWANPELAFHEFEACSLLKEKLTDSGFQVICPAYGLETALEARLSVGHGGRTVCFNGEYDALPDIGHACGHNLIAFASLASAIGLASTMKKHSIPGTVIFMGTPAEESFAGKYIMAQNGAWRDCDACLMTHPGADLNTPVLTSKASLKLSVKYHGKAAHAAAAPWDGLNACDAIVMAYNGIALLRQQIAKSESIQGVILEAGKRSNIIPDYAEGVFSVRAQNSKGVRELFERVLPIFKGAAASTGCRLELEKGAFYEDVLTNLTLANRYRDYMLSHFGLGPEEMIPVEEAAVRYDSQASSDMGTCTYICPGMQPIFAIGAARAEHTREFQEAAGTEWAHGAALMAGQANALVGFDVLTDDGFWREVKREWELSVASGRR